MIPFLVENSLIFLLVILLAFLIDFRRSVDCWYFLVLFLTVGLIDNLFYLFTETFPFLEIISYHTWNDLLGCSWSPKLYSILFAFLLLLPLRKIISPVEIGLTFQQNRNSIRFSLIFIFFIVIGAIIIGLISNKGPFDLKALIYLAILPGLNEELIYRGFLLGFLNMVFDWRFILLGTRFGWGAILSSLAFLKQPEMNKMLKTNRMDLIFCVHFYIKMVNLRATYCFGF